MLIDDDGAEELLGERDGVGGEGGRGGGGGDIDEVGPVGVGEILFPLNAIGAAGNGSPGEIEIGIGEGRGGGDGSIGDVDGVEQLGEALAADGHALCGGGLGSSEVGG